MAIRKKKVYKFSDEVMAKDAIISLIFGGLGLISIIFVVVMGIVLKGAVPFGISAFLLVAAIMGVTGLLFALFALADSDGGILGKRMAVIVSLIDIVILAVLYIV
ncbi:MAG: hypothetical protein VZR64_04750 [Eubacterium sp.]|jgi:hypothetical protein|nr:hypothetical protein [Eubacterium sp.]MEE3398753.1 hypothetical protein [Eubacterium sp.]